VWAVCPHGPDDGCHCRKPQPGLILWAAGRLCTAPRDLVVIGDIGADVEAARRAGAQGILVPTPVTRPEETAAADHVAPDLLTAVQAVLSGPPPWDLAGPAAAPQRDAPDASAGPRGSAAHDSRPEPDAHPQRSRTGRTGADGRRPADPATGQAAPASATAPHAAAGRAAPGGPVTDAPGGVATDEAVRPATDEAVRPATDAAARPATEAAVRPATDATARPATDATARPATDATGRPDAPTGAARAARPGEPPVTSVPTDPAAGTGMAHVAAATAPAGPGAPSVPTDPAAQGRPGGSGNRRTPPSGTRPAVPDAGRRVR
jgi:hypothetical protein